MSYREPLPKFVKHGQSGLERKLLYYLVRRVDYPFELRLRDSTLWAPEDLPPLEHPFDFVPLFECGLRVFMFKTKSDREKVRKFLDGKTKQTTKRKRSKSRTRPNTKSRKR